jgi:CRISPR-associated protein Cas5d
VSLQGLEVWGDYALFTRPEAKIERLSYPVMTPSAARAIFDAVYIGFDGQDPPHSTFFWQVRRIEILKPIVFIGFSRNEVKGKATALHARNLSPLIADGTDETDKRSGRTQRQSRILCDVRYRIFAEPVVYDPQTTNIQAVIGTFRRRAKNGKCTHQPSFGCREFGAYFESVESVFSNGIDYDEEIGWMPYGIYDLSQPSHRWSQPSVSIFRAQIQNGVLEIPPFASDEVRKLGIGQL